MTEKAIARFWSKVDRRGPDECWPWTAAKRDNGYGVLSVDGRLTSPHRFALELSGVALGTLHALHSCDRRDCCNPAHLRPGTPKENGADKVARGRCNRGESVPGSRLTAGLVAELREKYAAGASIQSLAEHYGIHYDNARRAAKRLSWKHVP